MLIRMQVCTLIADVSPLIICSFVQPRIIIPRVLLYNDGGFDLSQDGKILAACAEYW